MAAWSVKICESLMKIQCFKHEIICLNSLKSHQNQITFHNRHSHLAYQHTKLWFSVKHTVCESLVSYNSSNLNVCWLCVEILKNYRQTHKIGILCNCKLWNAPWFCLIFLRISYIIDDYSCLKYCILTKVSQIMCLIDVHILVC